jgi:hypothetical protein
MWNKLHMMVSKPEAPQMELCIRVEFCAGNELRFSILPELPPVLPRTEAEVVLYRAPEFTSGQMCLPALCYPVDMQVYET